MKNFLFITSILFANVAQGAENQTRGIGQYPGATTEYFAPTVSWTDGGKLTNVALHRAAWASSAYDYNHTAHLVTDGICDSTEPATLKVSTPSGTLPRREAEWAIDGGRSQEPYLWAVAVGSSLITAVPCLSLLLSLNYRAW